MLLPMASVTKTSGGRARRAAVRGQVLDAVVRLLGQGQNFTTLNVGRICEEAGVARSAFYTNFADKTELLMQLAEPAIDEIFTTPNDWIQPNRDRGTTELTTRLVRTISLFRRHAGVLASFSEVIAYDREVARAWYTRIDALVDATGERISHAQQRGAIRSGLEPRSAAKLIVWGVERTISRYVSEAGDQNDEALARGMAEAVWAMLFAE